jgi:hypothetical protein
MIARIEHQLTNWVDGMKIHRRHFVDSENALLDAVRDAHAIHLTPYSFGLLLPLPGERKSLEIESRKSPSDTYRVTLSLCRAITAGGSRIELTPEVCGELVSNDVVDDVGQGVKGRSQPSVYYAVLTVNPFDRRPVGTPEDESPPRHPFAIPRYELHLMEESTLSAREFGIYHIPLAKYRFRSGELVADTAYIPPCVAIQSHPGIIQVYKTIGDSYNRLQEACTTLVHKVHAKNQNTALAQHIKRLAEVNVQHISSLYFSFRSILPFQPPVFTAQTVVQAANMAKGYIEFMPDKEKEEMLQYFKEWRELTPSAFMEILTDAIDVEYDHYQLQESFKPLLQFLDVWTDLFEKLAGLELIGRRKQSAVEVVRQMDADVKSVKKKGFSPLD